MVQNNETSQPPALHSNGFLFIGELSALTGADPKTIRFYERAGLLSPPRHGRFRTYLEHDVQRLKDVLAMRQMGVPIAKIRQLLSAHDSQLSIGDDAMTVSLLQSHMDTLKAKQLEVVRQIEVTNQTLAQCNKGENPFMRAE